MADGFLHRLATPGKEAGRKSDDSLHVRFGKAVDAASKKAARAIDPDDCIKYMEISVELFKRVDKYTPAERLEEIND